MRESQLASLAHRDQQPISEEPPITQLMMSNDRRIRVSWLLGNVSRKCGTLLIERMYRGVKMYFNVPLFS